MNPCKSIILSSLVLLPAFAYAEMEPIIVTPTRTAQTENKSSATVYVLSKEEIEKSGARTTSDLLRGIPGIQIDDLFGNGTETNISVRGFSSTANANTLVLVNGRRLNHSDTSSPDLHHIFPKDIERIEVLVGSAGSLYGDQAVGGVINIITRRWGRDYQQVSVSAGSFDYKGIEFNSSQQISDALRYRLSAEKFQADHYRDHNAEENSNVYGVLEYVGFEHSMYLEVQKIDDELELPGALLKSEFDDDPTQSHPSFANDFINEDTTVSSIGYERNIGDQYFSIDATRRKTDADIFQSFRNFPSPSAGFTKRKNSSVNPKLSGIVNASVETPYVVGIDLEETDYELEIPNVFFTTTASNEQEVESIYFQLMPKLTETLQLTFGMRHSSVKNDMKDGSSFPTGIKVDDDITVNELGLSFYVDDDTKLTVRYDENFRFAKVNELALALPGEVLDTQTGESFELGVELVRGNHQLIVSIYQLNLENEIEFDPINFININLDKTRRNGVTLSLSSQINPMVSIKTELGLVNAKFKSGSFDGNDISGVADRIAKIRADYLFRDNLATYLEVHYTGEKFAQGDNANVFGKLDSYTVLNAGVSYQQKNWDIQLRINNLADEKYAEFITNNGFGAAYQPSPERNYMFSASYQFK
jgi:iron complex outermembrane receptor protein